MENLMGESKRVYAKAKNNAHSYLHTIEQKQVPQPIGLADRTENLSVEEEKMRVKKENQIKAEIEAIRLKNQKKVEFRRPTNCWAGAN
jgi:DNA-directed RNA polymerase subunit E'/Rpb7